MYLVHSISFAIQGMAVLLPWNSLLSASDFFIYLYGPHIMSIFAVLYSLPNLLMLLVQLATPEAFAKTHFSYFSLILVFFFMCIVAPFSGLISVWMSLTLYLFSVLFIAVTEALLQSAILGYCAEVANMTSSTVISAYLTGNAFSGIFTSSIRIFTKAAGVNQDDNWAALWKTSMVYFACGGVFVIVGWAFTGFTRYCWRLKPREEPHVEDLSNTVSPNEMLELKDIETPNTAEVENSESAHSDEIFEDQTLEPEITKPTFGKEENDDSVVEEDLFVLASSTPKSNLSAMRKSWNVFSRLWLLCVAQIVTLTVTLSVLPSIIPNIPSVFGGGSSQVAKEWLSVFLIFTFNVGDAIGRIVFPCLKLNSFAVYVGVALRIMFIPAFILCIDPFRLLKHDLFAWILTFSMAVSNGFFCNRICIIAANEKTTLSEDRRIAGKLMALFIVVGVCTGSLVAVMIDIFLCLVDPDMCTIA